MHDRHRRYKPDSKNVEAHPIQVVGNVVVKESMLNVKKNRSLHVPCMKSCLSVPIT
jgi:hypothetical protein